MRNILLSCALCLTVPVFSESPPIEYVNQESGFSIWLPKDFKHSWQIRNFDIGLEVNVFFEREYPFADHEYFAVIAQLPLSCTCCFDELEFMSMVIGELDNIPIGNIYIERDGMVLQATPMPTIGLNGVEGQRMHMDLSWDKDRDETVIAEAQFFVRGSHAFMVLIGSMLRDCDCPESLEKFTQEVCQSIRFDSNH